MPMADILLSAAESYTSEAAASSNLSGDDRRPKSVKGTTPPPEHDLEGRTFAADHNYCDGCGILYSRGDAPFRSGPLLQSFWRTAVSLPNSRATVFQACAGQRTEAINAG